MFLIESKTHCDSKGVFKKLPNIHNRAHLPNQLKVHYADLKVSPYVCVHIKTIS